MNNNFFFSILLHHGAPVDCKDPRGYTALFYACKDGHLPNVISLIDNGANVNHKAEGGKTPLFRARSVNTILLLLGYGADPNLKMDENDLTASEYLIRLGVKVRNMKMDFNTGGTWSGNEH